LAKTWLTGAAPETWLLFLGALFILTTLVLPRGIFGLVKRPSLFRATTATSVPAGEQA
jgi:urea transport system permease protein